MTTLQTFLQLCDVYWVLAMIHIDELDTFGEKYGHYIASNK